MTNYYLGARVLEDPEPTPDRLGGRRFEDRELAPSNDPNATELGIDPDLSRLIGKIPTLVKDALEQGGKEI